MIHVEKGMRKEPGGVSVDPSRERLAALYIVLHGKLFRSINAIISG